MGRSALDSRLLLKLVKHHNDSQGSAVALRQISHASRMRSLVIQMGDDKGQIGNDFFGDARAQINIQPYTVREV